MHTRLLQAEDGLEGALHGHAELVRGGGSWTSAGIQLVRGATDSARIRLAVHGTAGNDIIEELKSGWGRGGEGCRKQPKSDDNSAAHLDYSLEVATGERFGTRLK